MIANEEPSREFWRAPVVQIASDISPQKFAQFVVDQLVPARDWAMQKQMVDLEQSLAAAILEANRIATLQPSEGV